MTLAAVNGAITPFNAKGTLNYLQHTNGNKITAGYSSGTLNSLTASSGQSLAIPLGNALLFVNAAGQAIRFAHNSAGPLVSADFTDGSSYTYDYDNEGHLISAADVSGMSRLRTIP